MTKYGERGYRYALLDAGHLAQNILLCCSSLGLAAMPTCAFADDELNELLGLDGCNEAAIYAIALGVLPAP
jgi:SagB-type dehydrogenase family enzyme